jgi:hypothetical protein
MQSTQGVVHCLRNRTARDADFNLCELTSALERRGWWWARLRLSGYAGGLPRMAVAEVVSLSQRNSGQKRIFSSGNPVDQVKSSGRPCLQSNDVKYSLVHACEIHCRSSRRERTAEEALRLNCRLALPWRQCSTHGVCSSSTKKAEDQPRSIKVATTISLSSTFSPPRHRLFFSALASARPVC